jgi:hypothetical protein
MDSDMVTEQETSLAYEFAAILREWLSEAEFEEVRRRNALPEYDDAGACASHDFCDANIVMEEAFKRVFNREPDVSTEADTDIWNTAWDTAKREFLTAQK